MPFSIDEFRNRVDLGNVGRGPAIVALLRHLTYNGVAAAGFHRIQQLWGGVPYNKQRAYAAAGRYLKQHVAGLVDAYPSRPEMRVREFRIMFGNVAGIPRYPLRFYHLVEFSWKSSNGRLDSLSKVGTREKVTRRPSAVASPIDPLHDNQVYPIYRAGNPRGGGNFGVNVDEHSIGNPSLIVKTPVTLGRIVLDQVYEYTTDGGAQWRPIPGASYTIEKGVRRRNRHGARSAATFFFRKRSSGQSTSPFHLEVSYPIGQKHPFGAIPVGAAGILGEVVDISQYGRLRTE